MAKKVSTRKGNLSPKKTASTKFKTKSKLKAKAKIESTLESPREPTRELEGGGLTPQSKMKLPRKNERDFRETQQTQAQPNTVNPAGRK